MKIIEFHGGLGNQMFEYVYYKYLKNKYPNDDFYSYCPHYAMSVHYGLEIDKWFDIEMPPSSILSGSIGFISYWGIRIMRRLNIALPWVSDDFHLDDSRTYHEGWYQNKKYFESVGGLTFKRNLDIGKTNLKILQQIENTNSVSVHIRRGDYLLAKNAKALGGICTKEYYDKALSIICKKVENPTFFFFSDDPDFVKGNFSLPNMYVVTNNKGEKSFLDMYLMAHSKNMILANSTFSCWAAYLNRCAELIIAPHKWNNKMELELNLHDWITL